MKPILLLMFVAGCATANVRRCDHPYQRGMWLTARSADDVAAPAPAARPMIEGPSPLVRPASWGLVVVTVHNEDELSVTVDLRCGAGGAARALSVRLAPFRERDVTFGVPRGRGVATRFACEVVDFHRGS